MVGSKHPRAWRFVALFSVLFLASSCRDGSQSLIKYELERESLSNGLNILLVENHSVPVVSYQSWFKVGSVDEKPGVTGLAHLFEHLMFKGTKKYGSKAFFRELESKGAEVNAFTTRDYTVYYQNFTPDLLEKVIDMESDRLRNIKFDQAALRTERQVVFEERRLRTDNSPHGKMYEALWELSFSRHPYHWPVIGYPEDLISLRVDELQAFFNDFYHPGNLTIVVSGDIDADKTYSLIKKYYGSIPERKRPERKVKKEPAQKAERRLTLVDNVAAEKFVQSYHICAAKNDDTYALDVLSNILFEGTSSRVHQKVVNELDLAKGISGSAFTPTYPGLMLISGTLKSGIEVDQVERVLDDIIFNIQKNGVSEQEVKVAVKQLAVELLDGIQTAHGLGQLIGTVETVLGDAEDFPDEVAKYMKVKPDDVKRVANKYLIPNNRSTVVLIPTEKKERQEKMKKAGKSS